jgi:hypothetical protein
MIPRAQAVGQAFARALGAGPRRGTLASQKLEIRAMAARRGRRSAALLAWPVATAFAVAAVAAVILAGWPRELLNAPALRAELDGRPVGDHASLTTDAAAVKKLEFSDGSKIVLQRSTAAELAALSDDRAQLTLTRGRISASIEKKSGVTWTVAAGPYAVRVVGTRFGVGWDAARQRLEVTVEEGRVRVSGGDLPREGVALDAGGKLERHYVAPRRTEAAGPAETADRRLESEPASAEEPSAPAPIAAARPRTSDAPVPAEEASAPWTALAEKGRYAEALATAKGLGFERLLAELSQNDLLMLANTARYSGDAALARRTLLRLRQRFAGTAAAQLATLYLARVAEDMDRNPPEAVRWLHDFLRESPTGDLAASARASLMSILVASGDSVRARAVAEDYLRHHPSGPHASKARSLLEQTRSR